MPNAERRTSGLRYLARSLPEARRARRDLPTLRRAGASALTCWGDAGARGVRAQRVRVQALLLLVRAGPGGESFLGEPGVRAAGVPWREREEEARAHLLAEAD